MPPVAAIDAANAADPHHEADGRPVELVYGERMSAELARLAPDASEALRIAARGQHVERWKLPREDYPEGRTGYLAWRTEQARRHAARVDGMMAEAGYDTEERARVTTLLRKEGIKRNSDTFVDSVAATDIGAFPDKSVAEALQRVPGITVSRLQSNDDSTHFSAEPAGVLIRGLTFVRTELNGRDAFSADGYRGLNFNDISPELMAGVDVYKNQTAEMVEGGIAGTVNLRTRLPLDPPDRVFSFTGRATYGGSPGDESASTPTARSGRARSDARSRIRRSSCTRWRCSMSRPRRRR